MACGCQKNRPAGTAVAAPAASAGSLFESVNASGQVVYRSRDKATAEREGSSRGGVRVRPAGTP